MGRVAIIHPNLGIGGAERLIIDLSLSLKRKKHDVTIFTNYYSKTHCFEATKTNMDIISAFSFIPDSIFGAVKVYLAAIKILLLTLYFMLFYSRNYDLVIVDQIAVLAIPLLRICNKKTFFYCHFPDQFLTTRETYWKKFYRILIDYLEIYCTKFADIIVVNSQFTKSVILESFPVISIKYKKNPDWMTVLYPCVSDTLSELPKINFGKFDYLFVSINRFDSKKLVERAVVAMSQLREKVDADSFSKSHLVIMGGCDPNSPSDQECYDRLEWLAKKCKLRGSDIDHVTFLKNPNDETKISILSKATALIYTPDNEHFGIVPLESMMIGVPVLASASGGPLETVIDGVTGFHVKHFPDGLVDKMKFLIENPDERVKMGIAAREHCIKNFTFDSFDRKLDNIIKKFIT